MVRYPLALIDAFLVFLIPHLLKLLHTIRHR